MRTKRQVLKCHFQAMKARIKAKEQNTERSKEMTEVSRGKVIHKLFGVWQSEEGV